MNLLVYSVNHNNDYFFHIYIYIYIYTRGYTDIYIYMMEK